MLRSALTLALLIAAVPVGAQQNYDAVQIRAEQVAPGVAVLFGAGGNMAVSHGPDGTILIDDQFAPLTPRILAAIEALGAAAPRYLINTHWHGDHTGGNANLGQAGTIIMAHDHVRDRLSTEQRRGDRVTPPSPAAALPSITWHDGLTLHLNGGIRTMHAPHAHTDGDSMVWFPTANVLHMGDLFFHQVTLPFIDIDSGGNVRGMLAAANRALDIVDERTVIIPGHGPLAHRADLVAYRDMLAEMIALVEREKAAGKSPDQIIALRPAARWDTNPDAFIKGDAFITAIWRSLDAPVDEAEHSHAEPARYRH